LRLLSLVGLKQHFGRVHVVLEESELLLHELQLADEELLLHIEILDEFCRMVAYIDCCGL
jgi:hypothetical protein